MRYDEFRDRLQGALREVGLFECVGDPTETIELSSTGRRWQVYVLRSSPPSTEPFDVSAGISFNWSPFETARGFTCEEDLLTELLGRKQRVPKTAQRLVRVDLELHATLPYASTTALPEPQVFGSWTDAVNMRFGNLFTEVRERQGRVVAVLGARQEVEIEARCDSEGVLSLKAVSVAGRRLVRVPRVWDDPDRRNAEKGAAQEVARLARLFKNASDEWLECVAELSRWIRYAPPPPEAKPVEPLFEDPEVDEEGGGPETIH